MTTDMPEQTRDATASVIYCIDNNKIINKLLHDMLHTCKTVEEYTEKLNGLVSIFWDKVTPEGKNLDEVKWIDVMVQILPTECLIPVFEASMLKLKGRENENEGTTKPCTK